jgi:acyl carrier protein
MSDEVRDAVDQATSQERHELVEDLVVRVFRELTLLIDGEELDLDVSFFDLGLTSLRLTEAKQRLEAELDLSIDVTVMFNRPTIEDLVGHLDELLCRPPALPDRSPQRVEAAFG